MPAPLNELSNSNQTKIPYVINNRKSGFSSMFGSIAIAFGAFATALSTAVPDASVQSTGLVANGQAGELAIWNLRPCP